MLEWGTQTLKQSCVSKKFTTWISCSYRCCPEADFRERQLPFPKLDPHLWNKEHGNHQLRTSQCKAQIRASLILVTNLNDSDKKKKKKKQPEREGKNKLRTIQLIHPFCNTNCVTTTTAPFLWLFKTPLFKTLSGLPLPFQ